MSTEKRPLTFAQAQRKLLDLQIEFSLVARDNRTDTMREIAAEKVDFPGGVSRSIKFTDLGPQDGMTALHHAALGDARDAAAYLLENKMPVNILNHAKQTPLHMSGLSQKTSATAQFLIENGADINARDSSGKTPLHIAAKGGNIKVIETLIEAGADIHAKDNSDNEPLHAAVLSEKTGAITVLFEKGGYGADQFLETRAKALGYSVFARNPQVKGLLEALEKKAEKKRKDENEAQYQELRKKRLSIIDDIIQKTRKPGGGKAP